MKYDATFKLILIGDSGVGKSCIINRIGSNTFNEDHEVTLGAEFTTIAAQINKKNFIKMQFWDSCGQERYNSITRIFYRGSQCVLLVYDVQNGQTLRNLEQIWIDDLQANLKDALIILVANKIDIDDETKTKFKRQVTQEDGLNFKNKHKLNYFTEVSAKTGKGIPELVDYISRLLFHEYKMKANDYRDVETGSVSSKSKSSLSFPSQSPYSDSQYSNMKTGKQGQGGQNGNKKLQKMLAPPTKKQNECC